MGNVAGLFDNNVTLYIQSIVKTVQTEKENIVAYLFQAPRRVEGICPATDKPPPLTTMLCGPWAC